VEDELVNNNLMELIVRRLPDTALLLADGAHRGLKLAAKHGPGMIVMDAHPRDMSGTEALERLRRYEKDPRYSRHRHEHGGHDGKVRKGRRKEFQSTVAKPIDTDEVVAAIEDAFAKSL
jgi:CheY-like chemotaxis protein